MRWVLRQEGEPPVSHVLDPRQANRIGRGSACEIRLTDGEVSRNHCALQFEDGCWHVRDLNSENGVELNGESTALGAMKPGDVIGVGPYRLTLVQVAPAGKGPSATKPDKQAPPSQPTVDAQTVGNRYRLEEPFHIGATGTFHRALDVASQRTVCVKLLSRQVIQNESDLKRFVRGVRASEPLSHRNIVRLYRAGKTKDKWWLAMEYVDGPSVRQLAQTHGIGNMLSASRVFSIAVDITAALEVAFEHSLVHRNIKPDSILTTKRGTAKLSNFSLLRGVVLATLQQITASRELVGDLAYLPPESTDPDAEVDCRSDLYSLGACLYTLLAGRPPFTGVGTVDLLKKVRSQAPEPPSKFNLSVPRPLEAIVLKCLEKSPTDRFATPALLSKELIRVGKFESL